MKTPMTRLLARFRTLLMLLAVLLAACGGREHADLAPPMPLSLLVLDPAEGATLHVATTPVRGKVLGKAILGFNGRPLALSADGGFATTLELVEGENRLNFDVWPESASGRGSELLPNSPPALHLTRVVTFVRAALTVQFTAPAENAVLSLSPAQVAGMVSEPDAAVTVNAVAAQVDPTGRFTVAVPLLPGPNLLKAVASVGGRTAQAQRQVVYAPPAAPAVRILEPAEGLITNLAQVTVKGTVSDPVATLRVQGTAVAVNPDGSWSTSLAPAEGPLTITAEVINSAGQTSTDARHLVIDRTPPRIVPDGPVPDFTRLTQLPLAGKVVDATSCQLWIQEAATVLTGPPATARFSTSVALVEGSNSLGFRAVDAAGNVGTLVLTVVRDAQGPGLTLDPLPPDGECTLTVKGHANETGTAVTFTRDGVALPSANNAFSFLWSLNPGPNSTTLRAIDALGNASELVLTRTCTAGPPPADALVLTVTAPLEGQVFPQPSAAAAGRVSPASATVTLNGAPLSVQGDGAFTATATLLPGANTLTFLARHPDGRTVSESRNVIYQQGGSGNPPVITFDDPRDGTATRAHSITVLGHVDDPLAALTLQGRAVPLDAQGRFQLTLSPEREGVLGIRAEALNKFGTGRNAMYVSFQWSGLQMAWTDPTPAEGARLTTPDLTAAVTLSRAALVDFNGQAGALEPNEQGPHPFRAQADLTVEEGQLLLTATAVDGGGNRATLSRRVAVGLTAPTLSFTAPAFDPSGVFRTLQAGVSVTGTVTAPDAVKPLSLTLNGQIVPLDAQGGFSWTFSALAYGPNALHAIATNSFAQTSSVDRTVERVQDSGGDQAPRIIVESPLEGFATGAVSLPVVGRVNQPGLTVKVQNRAVSVDPLTLRFSATADLAIGANTLVATAADTQGRSDTATLHGTRYETGQIKYRWDQPANRARLASRTVIPAGQADQPGIAALTINGVPMALSGSGAAGAFRGSLVLPKGPQTLLLEALTVAGERLSERRDVIIDPPLPRIILDAPASARPGDRISLTVKPAPGTTLVRADLSWNGALLAQVQDPFPAQSATIPADAPFGTKLRVEAVGIDLEGESVTARTYVTVLGGGSGGGPLVLAGFDDRTGLPLAGAGVRVEGGSLISMGDAGLATLPALLPGAWVTVEKSGFTPVWRRGDQLGSKPQALFDARPTPLDPGRDATPGGYVGAFAKDAFTLTIPAGALSAAGKVSLTPLGTQGLPALLPKGWSALSALWLQLDGAALSAPATLKQAAVPGMPTTGLVWTRWNEIAKTWEALSINVDSSQLTALILPNAGGYALLAADPAPTTPPTAVVGQALRGTEAGPWRTGMAASGAVDPSLLPTVEAISGARATAKLDLGFGGHDPVASGTGLLAEIVETYTRVDQSLIEPEKRAQDGVGCRFVLGVDKDGGPTLRAISDGLAMELPVRMSRTFAANELVEGLIQVGFYHEDQVIAVGGELIGNSGGSTTRDGITASFEAGAFSSSTLVRVQGDPAGSWDSLWPELKDLGRVASSFSVDVSGVISKGMVLSIADLGSVPAGIVPLLLQRRIVADQRLLVAVGALESKDGAWKLSLPAESNPILEGGAFAVLVPAKAWSWVTGTVSMPEGLAQAIRQALGSKGDSQKNLVSSPPSPKSPSSLLNSQLQEFKGMEGIQGMKGITDKKEFIVNAIPPGDVAVKEALVSGNFIQAASGHTGVFALPAFAPMAGKLHFTGQRWDLGLTGSVDVDAPSSNNALRLTTIPFAIMAVLPAENAVVIQSAMFSVLTTTPMDPSSLAGIKLYQGASPSSPISPSSLLNSSAHEFKGMEGIKGMNGIKSQNYLLSSSSVEMNVRKQLSIDGRTLVITPESSLLQGTAYVLVVDGLKSLAGEPVARIERHVNTAVAPPPPAEADFSRIVLGYPDASFNVAMTIPAGAIPAGASILIEGLGMGFTHTGTMPNGELKLTIRASLGERIRITVQIAGRTTEGYVSRYQAGDGRVTIGVDGGRAEATDGSGAAVVLPAGALEIPREFSVTFNQGRPADLHGDDSGETVVGVVHLKYQGDLVLRRQPVWEFPRPVMPNTSPRPPGLGPYAVYVRSQDYEANGVPTFVWELQDFARIQDGKLRSFGLLPAVDLEVWGGTTTHPSTATSVHIRAGNPLNPVTQGALVGVAATSAVGMNGSLDAMSIDAGEYFLAGEVFRHFEGRPNFWPFAVRAAIYAAAISSGPGALQKAGRLVSRTNELGRYFIASSQAGELTRGNVRLMAMDPDYGITAHTTSTLTIPLGTYGTWYEASPMYLEIGISDEQDRIAPWVEVRFEGSDVIGEQEARFPGDGQDGEIFAVVNAYDLRDHWDLPIEILVDGVKVPAADVTFSRTGATLGLFGGTGKWKARLRGEIKLTPGVHSVEARVEDRSRNQSRIERNLRVLDIGIEPAIDPENPPGFNLEVDGSLEDAKPTTMIRVKFSEPVSGVQIDTLVLEKQDSGGAWAWVEAHRVGDQGSVRSTQRLHTVYIIPYAQMETGARYRVRATNTIVDFDSPPKRISQGPKEFRIAQWRELANCPIPEGPIKRVAVVGGRTFVAVPKRIYMVRAGGVTVNLAPVRFGVTGSGGNDFLGQEITEMKVFRQVPTPQFAGMMDLLLVTTAPRLGDEDRQCVLWAFNVCNGMPLPRLMFAVSLGPGASGYTPNLDCRGGLITVGRVASSFQVISVKAAVEGWNGDILACVQPGGNNQKAVVQPFYVSNPEGKYGIYNPGVAMLPPQVDPATGGVASGLPIAVGFTPGEIARQGVPLRGLPTMVLRTDPSGSLKADPPFMPLSGNPTGLEPDERVFPGRLDTHAAGTRVSVLSNIQVTDPNGLKRQTSLAITWTSWVDAFGGPSLGIMDEGKLGNAVYLGRWPAEALGMSNGRPMPYDLPFVTPSVDPITGLVAVPVKFTGTGKIEWFILDFYMPHKPRTVARIPANGQFGSFHNGILSVGVTSGSTNSVTITKVVDGLLSVDEGECVLYRASVLVVSESGTNTDEGVSGLSVKGWKIKLNGGVPVTLRECTWLMVQKNGSTTWELPSALVESEIYQTIKLRLKVSTAGRYAVELYAKDASETPPPWNNYGFWDFWQDKPFKLEMDADGR